jgi:hypothetical protein
MPRVRMSQSRRIIIVWSVLLVLLFSPWLTIAMVSIRGKIDAWIYRPTARFSDVRWKKPDFKYRYSALQEVLEHQIRPGMTQNDVKSRLGEPDSLVQGGWQYEALRPGWHFMDSQGGGLLVTFSNQNTVEDVENNHWVD